MAKHVTAGEVAFACLDTTDVYNGKDTGRYTMTLRLDPVEAEPMEAMGVRIKEYEGIPQRKFSSNRKVAVIGLDGEPFDGSVTRGAQVRVQWVSGNPHPQWGTPTFMEKIRVVEAGEVEQADEL